MSWIMTSAAEPLPTAGEALSYAEGFQAALKQVENSEVASLIEEVAALSAQLAFERAVCMTAKTERDEADRRAGAAERVLDSYEEERVARMNWLDEAKKAAGYDRNTSFDEVWTKALSALLEKAETGL
jgi:hypothetical protein